LLILAWKALMAQVIRRLTEEGQLALPQELQAVLRIKPGDRVALTPTADGVLLKRAEAPAETENELDLRNLAPLIRAELEAKGITEEDQLTPQIKETKREAFERHYGCLAR
jgi:bifunctional DNA-binding transcriptional regulator/antitoxin component of YhaV-PrlF toxin-antitoxin module